MDSEARALVMNAQQHLDLLRSTIHDGLTNQSDLFLKVSLLQDLEAVDQSLSRALL